MNILLKLLNKRANYKTSYSQSGEDLIVRYIFNFLQIKKPTYIDIGAHHPFNLSNTALFYENGSTGINIEPDPISFNIIKKYRKNDININVGIHTQAGELDFYLMSSPSLNTFSEKEARECEVMGYTITEIKKVKVISIENVISTYCNNIFPDFLSLDVEGLDLTILQGIDFTKHGPKVICVESVEFRGDKSLGEKDNKIKLFLENKGYRLYADTFINSIFIREDVFK